MQVAIVGDSNSGGEAVCDLLSGLGYTVGVNGCNRTAHVGEIDSLLSINSKVAAALGGTLDCPPQLPDNWASQSFLNPYYDQAIDAVDKLNRKSVNWAFRDLTTNITSSFWKRVIPDLHFAVCVSNPLAAAAQDPAKSSVERSFAYAKWHWVYLNLLGAIDPDSRLTLVHDQLVESKERQLRVAKYFQPNGVDSAIAASLPAFKQNGCGSSIDDLLADHEIHEAARRFYLGLLSGDDNSEIQRQLATRDVLLSVLHPILERSTAYDAVSSRCSKLEHELFEIQRSQSVAKNLGLTLATKAVQVARRSKALFVRNSNNGSQPVPVAVAEPEKSNNGDSTLTIDSRPNARRIIVCAGHERSGSTWLFNVVRCAHICAGYKTYGAWIDKYNPAVAADVHVVKTHHFHEGLSTAADIVVVSKRDLRDCAASILRKQWVGTTPYEVAATLRDVVTKSILPWRECANLTVAYEDVVKDKVGEIAIVLRKLGLNEIDPKEVHRWVENLTSEIYPDVNPTTLLHPQHITDGGVRSFGKTLNPDQLAAVMGVCAEFENESLITQEPPVIDDQMQFGYQPRTAAVRSPGSSSRPLVYRPQMQRSVARTDAQSMSPQAFANPDDSLPARPVE